MAVSLTCSEIAEAIDAAVIGDGSTSITSIASIDTAAEGSITFVVSPRYLDALRSTKASAVIVTGNLSSETKTTRLVMENPYLGYAKLTRLWVARQVCQPTSIHRSASVAENADIADKVEIGANAVIDEGAVLGDEVVIGAGAYIGRGTVIGRGTTIHPNATVLHGCKIGFDCEIHSGAIIGADGFGFAPAPNGWEKIYQLGAVQVGDRVSIGACTTVDRGALEDTVIGDGVILDNHIQVAHNVTIGENTAIAGCTGIAGSTTIGANCRIGGAVSIVGHISISDNVLITANSFVNRAVTESGSYSSGFPLQPSKQWRKNAVRLHKLDELSRQVSKLKS